MVKSLQFMSSCGVRARDVTLGNGKSDDDDDEGGLHSTHFTRRIRTVKPGPEVALDSLM